MNVDNNQRFRETEEKIFNAYGKMAASKELEKITVSDICREAGIHRTTFYGHFTDIIELHEKVMKHQFQNFLLFFENDGNWDLKEGIRKQLQFYYDCRRIIRMHLKKSTSRKEFYDFFEERVISDYLSSYQSVTGCASQTEAEYHQTFFCAGIVAIIKKWVMSDCTVSPEEMTEIMYHLYKRMLVA